MAFAGVLIGMIIAASRVSRNMIAVAKVNLFVFIYVFLPKKYALSLLNILPCWAAVLIIGHLSYIMGCMKLNLSKKRKDKERYEKAKIGAKRVKLAEYRRKIDKADAANRKVPNEVFDAVYNLEDKIAEREGRLS